MLNLRRVDLNLLTAFEAIFAERNLTKAAARISMSQPAMSNALNRLRHLFKDDLFVRQGNTMQPTQRAQQIAVQVQQALNLIREGLSEVDEFDPLNGRIFNLSGIEYLDMVIMPKLFEVIGEYIPPVRINAFSGYVADGPNKLKSGDYDILIDIAIPDDEEFCVQQIGSDRLVSLIRQEHPAAGKTLTLEEALNLDYVVLQPRDEKGFYMERYLRAQGKEERIVAKLAHMPTLPLIVSRADYVCTIPESIASFFKKQLGLIELDAPIPEHELPVMMTWHHTQTHDAGHKWLREKLAEAASLLLPTKPS